MNKEREARKYLRLLSVRRCRHITTIVELVREVIEPAILAPYELVDIEYGKMGGDYVLSVFVDKPEGITVNDTADLTDIISPILDQIKPDPLPGTVFSGSDQSGAWSVRSRPRNSYPMQSAVISMSVSIRLLTSRKSLKAPCWVLKRMFCTWNIWTRLAEKKSKFPTVWFPKPD